MLIRQALMGLIGISSGFITAGGIFALIVSIGIIPRMAGKTRTAYNINWYENSIIAGGILGNIVYLYSLLVPLGRFGLAVYGIFSGIFVGSLAIALAETLNTIPVFTRRIHLKKGIGFLLLGMAVGKSLGSLLYFFRRW